ncbi:DNA-binding protein, partial [Escherichia coli]|nr:DNA-binding protein [Escherichia coli]
MIQRYFKEPLLQLTGELGRPDYTLADRKRLVRLLTQDMQRGD